VEHVPANELRLEIRNVKELRLVSRQRLYVVEGFSELEQGRVGRDQPMSHAAPVGIVIHQDTLL